MSNFLVFSDSACDINTQYAKENNIQIIPLKVSFDRVNKLAEGTDININDFYERLKDSPLVPKTYFPTVREYVAAFKEPLAKGYDVLCLCLSSKLSRGYEAACNASKILSRAYTSNKVVVVDSLLAAGGQAALTISATKLRDAGFSVDDAYKKLTELRDSSTTIFTVRSLEQLARGGRMSRATATIGTLLHINPIIHMENGELLSREKAIGRSKAISMLKQLVIDATNKKPNDYVFTVFHSRSYDEAKKIQTDLEYSHNVTWFNPIVEVGASIGSHTGTSVLALNCMKRV